jgi:pyrroline-5-carboxylate reductase
LHLVRFFAFCTMLKLGLIGCGKMGGALLRGVCQAMDGQQELRLMLCDAVPAAVKSLRESLSAQVDAGTPAQVAAEADLILLAVKPQDLHALCQTLAALSGSRLYMSIAAGVSLADLEQWLGGNQRVIRAMPNTPALVGAGAAAFARGRLATDADAALARQILSGVGSVDEVQEKLLDAVTGLSGSGPAYVYTFIEALADGGVLKGLPRTTALQLAAQTVLGAAKMVLETGKHPAVLRDEVTSPGGTTIAGIEQLELHGLRAALLQAVRAATERSEELGSR